MKIDTTEKWLPIYEALASDVRLKIIGLLAQKPMNIKELAAELQLSSAIVSMHVKKLEKGQIITSERNTARGAVQKVCSLSVDWLEIEFPNAETRDRKFHKFTVPVGHYTGFYAVPTCGLATVERVIGQFDDPRYFLDPERVNASILWLSEGYFEYKVPNYLLHGQQPEELEISMELGSEAPGVNPHWPSDITFFLNDCNLGSWTSPGDFGGARGRYTPGWWSLSVNQYGLYKVLKVNFEGTFIDGIKISDVTLNRLDIRQKYWTFKIAALENTRNKGGLTLFGKGFGNYSQDIVFKLYYSAVERELGK